MLRLREKWLICSAAIGFAVVVSVVAQDASLPASRFVWRVHRLHMAGPTTSKTLVTKEPILLKFDTGTGRIWRYAGSFEDVSGSLLRIGEERFAIIPVEGLGRKFKKEEIRTGRFQLIRIQVPTVIKKDKTATTIDKPELMLLDTDSGRNWMLRRVYEDIDGTTTKVYKFVLLSNDDDGTDALDKDTAGVDTPEEDAAEPVAAAQEQQQEVEKEEPIGSKVVLPLDAFAPVSPFTKYQKTDSWWRKVYLKKYKGNTFKARNRAEVDCVILVAKEEGGELPWIVVRDRASSIRPLPEAGPRQKKLISDAAIDHICRAAHVPINDAARLAIFISNEGKVKGFVNVDAATVDAIPEKNKISGVLFVD